MVIIKERDLSDANEVFARYGTRPVYSVLPYNGSRYLVYDGGMTAALLEVDMKMGCKYEGGKIIDHDQI